MGGFLSQVANVFTGSEDAKAAKKASKASQAALGEARGVVQDAGTQAQNLLQPFAELGQSGISQAGFLTSPTAQFDFLQNNPLFDLGLQNLNEQTQNIAASRGRITAGDTLEQLNQNALIAGQPLIDRQRQDILNLLNIGQGTAGQQAGITQNTAANVGNLITGQGQAQAQGILGSQQARGAGIGNIIDLGTTIAGLPSGTFSNPFSGIFGGSTPPPTSPFANFPPV